MNQIDLQFEIAECVGARNAFLYRLLSINGSVNACWNTTLQSVMLSHVTVSYFLICFWWVPDCIHQKSNHRVCTTKQISCAPLQPHNPLHKKHVLDNKRSLCRGEGMRQQLSPWRLVAHRDNPDKTRSMEHVRASNVCCIQPVQFSLTCARPCNFPPSAFVSVHGWYY